MNTHQTVTEIRYPPPDEKCLTETEKATEHISRTEDDTDLESNYSEQEISKDPKCYENLMPMAINAEQQNNSWHCSGSDGGPFFLAIDPATVAAIKGGAQYTLVPVDEEKKALAVNVYADENADPNRPSTDANTDMNKVVHMQIPGPIMPALLPSTSGFQHFVKPEFDDIIRNSEERTDRESNDASNADDKTCAEQKCSQYSPIPLTQMVPSTATAENISQREKGCLLPRNSEQVAEYQTFSEEYKDMVHTPLITKLQRVKHETGLQSCINMSTPRSTFIQQAGGAPMPLPVPPHSNHSRQSRIIYTSTSGLRRPFPYQTAKLSHGRGYHVRTPWGPSCIPTSTIQGPQMVLSTPMNVTPSSNPNSGNASNASGVTLNSSGEEVRQDSSPEFPRTPFNTPNSTEVDVGNVQRVIAPDGHQLAQYVSQMENNMRYYVPFSVREDHNQKERERRGRIKVSCQKLRSLIPGLNDKTDKATVFEYAASYLDFLKMKIDSRYDKEFLEKHFPYQ